MKFFLFSILVLLAASCKKQTIQAIQEVPVSRNIKFIIYTSENFSNNNSNITFTLTVRNIASRIIWDSVLPPMKIKDIPDRQHTVTIEKKLEHDPSAALRVGVIYAIEHVGISWHYDSLRSGELNKIIDFNFR